MVVVDDRTMWTEERFVGRMGVVYPWWSVVVVEVLTMARMMRTTINQGRQIYWEVVRVSG